MINPKEVIDNLIQEHGGDLPTLVIQKLGELREALTTRTEGKGDNVMEEVSKAVVEVVESHNISIINLAILPGDELKSATTIHLV